MAEVSEYTVIGYTAMVGGLKSIGNTVGDSMWHVYVKAASPAGAASKAELTIKRGMPRALCFRAVYVIEGKHYVDQMGR